MNRQKYYPQLWQRKINVTHSCLINNNIFRQISDDHTVTSWYIFWQKLHEKHSNARDKRNFWTNLTKETGPLNYRAASFSMLQCCKVTPNRRYWGRYSPSLPPPPREDGVPNLSYTCWSCLEICYTLVILDNKCVVLVNRTSIANMM